MAQSSTAPLSATIRAAPGAAPDTLNLTLEGRLDSHTTGAVWREAMAILDREAPRRLTIDGSALAYCDGAGIGLLLELCRRQRRAGREWQPPRLPERFARLFAEFDPAEFDKAEAVPPPPTNLPHEIGVWFVGLYRATRELVTFVGELTVNLVRAAAHPRRIRWADTLRIAENAGVNAMPIVVLIGFLLGLILAFQSATFMKRYGAEVFVANLVSVSMLRELGPLMTAIILAGRSGSAFAAELGTMKVRDEIDALTTMGLEPLRFLIVPRVIAAVAIMPLLTLFCNLAGLIGGAVVLKSFGYTLATYISQVQDTCNVMDFAGGLVKSLALGVLVAGIGCLRGLQTKSGASAVGDSTTQAVVSGIVLIAICDSVFSIVYYSLGI